MISKISKSTVSPKKEYLDQEKEDYSNDSDVEESDSDDDDLAANLDRIGSFPAIKLPSFWSSNNSPGIKDDLSTHNISRREQLSNFIEDLKSGFSLQSALDRFQTIRTILESSIDETIQNNVDTDSEDEHNGLDTEENYEPTVITPATEPKGVPTLLDQVIIPQSKEPRRKKKLRAFRASEEHATNSEIDDLTIVSKDDMKNEDLLRKRIIMIRRLSISEDEKNRLVQKLMMGTFYDNVKFVDDNGDEVFRITSEKSKENDNLDEEDDVEEDVNFPEETNDVEDENVKPIVRDEDKVATYHDDEELIMGCQHYQRNCKLECSKCKKWYCCPLCHDDDVSTHKMKREETKHIMCMNCFQPQVPGEFCEFCDLRFAFYHCSKCQLYDNDESKDIYHCDGCGICRLGLGLGQDFFHCDGCNACLSIELQDDHKCIERATQSDCPICGEFMFTSTRPVVFMSCGHAIHQGCYEDHSKHSYKCPTCQKTILSMEAQFRVLDMEISLQPLPEPYSQWTCIISCNDCNAKSSCPYHVLGLKCDNCKSYNTVQKKLIKPEESDYDSDLSTTGKREKRSTINDLRNISMLNSNRLNTNYLIEELNRNDSTILLSTGNNSDIEKGNDAPGDSERTLTLPQQFLNNIDEYLANIEFGSSDDEEDDNDEVDFLGVNKTLKSIKKSELLTENDKAYVESTSDTNLASNFLSNAIRYLKTGQPDKDKLHERNE